MLNHLAYPRLLAFLPAAGPGLLPSGRGDELGDLGTVQSHSRAGLGVSPAQSGTVSLGTEGAPLVGLWTKGAPLLAPPLAIVLPSAPGQMFDVTR